MPYIEDGISHLTTEELKARLDIDDDRTIVIDVREVEEYEEKHIPGLPLIPMGDLIDIIDQFDREREYVFTCRSGRRSLEVAKFFTANGIMKVHNHAGGIISWEENEQPVTKDTDRIVTEFSMDKIERRTNK